VAIQARGFSGLATVITDALPNETLPDVDNRSVGF